MSSDISKINKLETSSKQAGQNAKTNFEQEIHIWQKEGEETNNYNRLPIRPDEFEQGLNYIESSINDAYFNFIGYKKGVLGMAANGFKEIFGLKSAQSKIEPIILEEKKNIEKLTSIAKYSPARFRAEFKKIRGVEFNLQNIKDLEDKKEEFALISTFNNVKDNFNNKLDNSLKKYEAYKDNKRPAGGHDRINYDNTIKDLKTNLKEGLKNIYKTDEAVENYIKNTAKEFGFELDKEMSKEKELKVWGQLATKSSENINTKFYEMTKGKSLEEYEEEYKNSYKKAYGNTNSKELSDAFLKTQQTGEQIAKIAVVIGTTVGTMGVATAINGASLGTKAAFALTKVSTGLSTTGISTLDDYTKDGKVDNFKEHIIEGSKASVYAAVGFGSSAISQSIKGAGTITKFGAELVMDATASTIFGFAVGDNQTLGENFLYSGAFMLPGLAGARIKGKPKVDFDNIKPVKKEPLALPEYTSQRAKLTEEFYNAKRQVDFEHYSKILKGKGNIELDKSINEIKNALPKDMQSSLKARAKGAESTYDKLVADAKRKNIVDLESSIKAVDDLIGTRLVLEDASPKEIDKLVNSLEKSILNGDIVITELRNYRGRNGSEYFNNGQIETLEEAVKTRYKETGEGPKKLGVKENNKEIKDSGYTTTQMKITHKEGEMGQSVLGEFQIRGKYINEFADVEHIPYDLRESKDLSKGNKELKEIYAPVQEKMIAMSKDDYAEYNEYLSALYKYYRNLENGTPKAPISVASKKHPIINHYPAGEKPKLPDKFDPILGEKGLHEIDDLAKAKKKELGIN